ncbi:MAG: flavin-containing monooxygenase [Myxococcaceae bacterium]
MATAQSESVTDVVVVGSGPAGLAVGACLRKAGIDFVLLEKGRALAPAWRQRYDRLHLHTDRSHSGLPYLPMPKAYPRYPSSAQMIEYLEAYAQRFSLAPRFGEEVTGARRAEGGWAVETQTGRYRARALVLATGYNAEPVRPQWPGMEAYQGVLLHSSEYRSGERFRGQDVLVVGFGNSGGEIAIDLFEHAARADIVVRGTVNLLPRELLGIPILTWGIALSHLPPPVADLLAAPLLRMSFGDLSRLGLRKAPAGPLTELATRKRVPLIDVGTVDLLRRKSIQVRPGIEAFTRDGARFVDGTEAPYQAVVLATGFRPRLAQVLANVDGVLDEAGMPLTSGREAVPALYLTGFYIAPTGMIREAGIEARRIVARLTQQLSHPVSPSQQGTADEVRNRVSGVSMDGRVH